MKIQTTKLIRVLIAEDSPTFRELLVSILQNAPDLQVVGTARNGIEALRLAKRLEPDIISMDIYMPEMDGIEATRLIMQQTPRPIVMISANLNQAERNLSFEALQAGALSVLEKPTLHDSPEAYTYLTNQIKLMSEVKVVRRWNKTAKQVTAQKTDARPPKEKQNGNLPITLAAIAASTGGPGALASILQKLPSNFPVPILIVQHITPGFSEGLADWLNGLTPLDVHLAQHGEKPLAGNILIAPDNHHMTVNNLRHISLNQSPPIQGLRPSANRLLTSVAQVYGKNAIGVVLTGMGSDGAEGLKTLRETGARTIVQNEKTCVVFGMPAIAIEMQAAEQIIALEQIAPAIIKLL